MAEEQEKVNFTESWTYSDVIFNVEDTKIYASRAVLALASPVFSTMFSSNFKEKNEAEIKLPGKKSEDFLELMKVLHYHRNTITKKNVYQLLPLVHEYQMKHLIDCCEQVLMTMRENFDQLQALLYLSLPQPNDTMKHLVLAERYELTKLRQQCINEAGNIELSDLERRLKYAEIEPGTLNEVLKSMLRKQVK